VKTVKVTNATRGRTIGARVGVADTYWRRLRGLIGRPPLESDEGLLLRPCRAVHMWGMTYPIDVAFLDSGNEVVALYRELAPGARTRWHGRAKCALELPGGKLAESGTEVGDVVEWAPAGNGNGTGAQEAVR
jgi:uncharacterized membrane protein (UPF0127 family)